jgi:hypothetical protein
MNNRFKPKTFTEGPHFLYRENANFPKLLWKAYLLWLKENKFLLNFPITKHNIGLNRKQT